MGNGGRGRLAVEFYEKRRKKAASGAGAWFGGRLAGRDGPEREEEVCWEVWTVDVTIATPRTESGILSPLLFFCLDW